MKILNTINAKANKKTILILAGVILIIAAIAFAIALSQTKDESDKTYVNKTVSDVHMVQTITAAGKLTVGEAKTIQFNKSKVFKAMSAEKNELVRKGRPLFFYTDGTHADAPYDGILNSISSPKNGEKADSSNSIKFSNTHDLYLKVLIPEDTINKISKGDTAEIVVNAYPDRKFEGKIINMRDISTLLMSQDNENKKTSESTDNTDSTDNGTDSSTDESADSQSDGDTGTDADTDNSTDSSTNDESTDGSESSGGDDEAYGEQSDAAYYAVNIKFANDGTLRPGMSANTIITISNRSDVMAVPVEAVYFDKKDRSYVYKMNGNSAEKTFVETGESDPINVEILKGLKKGDTIRIEKVNGGK